MYTNIIKKYKISSIFTTLFTVGFYRGTTIYNKEYKTYYDIYEENKEFYKKPNYLYINCLGYGLIHSIIYINPFFAPFILKKELYRLEVNIRNLEDEKNNNNYYNIF
jgi:hypothetical protein